MANTDFGAKLNLVLKALSLSRGRLAAELRIDKSLAGRWAAGTVTPSAHNLSSLTALIATRIAGFTLLDWELSLPSLAERLGVDAGVAAKESAGEGYAAIEFPTRLIDTARNETARRGHGFEGIWNAKRISFTRMGEYVRDVILIRKQNGILYMRWGNSAYECRGPLLQLAGQLHGILIDESDDSILFCLLNGVNMPQVEVIDGIFMAIAKDGPQTPCGAACLLERECNLVGDTPEDDRRYEELKSAAFLWDRAHITPDEYAHLMRDIGPKAYAAGGDLFLRSPLARSLSRGGARSESAVKTPV
jgi:transcriptional regulator with XRE-family HTH domain